MGRPVLMSRAQRAANMLDRVFGRLVVVAIKGKNAQGKLIYETLCECTTPKDALGEELRSGKVQSCGCLRKELARAKARLGGAATKAKWNHLSQAA